MQNEEGTNDLAIDGGIRFETISDRLMDVERVTQDYGLILSMATSMCCAVTLSELIARLVYIYVNVKHIKVNEGIIYKCIRYFEKKMCYTLVPQTSLLCDNHVKEGKRKIEKPSGQYLGLFVMSNWLVLV
jgi:hypothetical protein